MTESKPCSDASFLEAWKTEIDYGIGRGKLVKSGGLADLKAIPVTLEDHAELKQKSGK